MNMKKKRDGGKNDGDEEKTKMKRIRFMAWNVNGMKDTEKTKRKFNRILNEMNGYEVVILTEIHLKDDEIERYKKMMRKRKWMSYFSNNKSVSRGGVMISVRMGVMDESQIEAEDDGGEGRCLMLTMKNVWSEDVVLCGLYAPVNGLERQTWMKKVGKRMKKKKGMKMIAGDMNFVMDTRLDKIRGNPKRGTAGREQQQTWEREMNVTDIWRDRNPTTIATT